MAAVQGILDVRLQMEGAAAGGRHYRDAARLCFHYGVLQRLVERLLQYHSGGLAGEFLLLSEILANVHGDLHLYRSKP